jgi:hypothetical protein
VNIQIRQLLNGNKRAKHIYLMKNSELIQGILHPLFREALIIPVIIKQFVD